MPAEWHQTRWWDWYMSKDRKKRMDPSFSDKN